MKTPGKSSGKCQTFLCLSRVRWGRHRWMSGKEHREVLLCFLPALLLCTASCLTLLQIQWVNLDQGVCPFSGGPRVIGTPCYTQQGRHSEVPPPLGYKPHGWAPFRDQHQLLLSPTEFGGAQIWCSSFDVSNGPGCAWWHLTSPEASHPSAHGPLWHNPSVLESWTPLEDFSLSRTGEATLHSSHSSKQALMLVPIPIKPTSCHSTVVTGPFPLITLSEYGATRRPR